MAEDIAKYFVQSRPIIDHTGLTGSYDINLPPTAEPAPPNRTRTDPLILAKELLKKLGLGLIPGAAPVPVMTIDDFERPTPN